MESQLIRQFQMGYNIIRGLLKEYNIKDDQREQKEKNVHKTNKTNKIP
jgi:hypothetical protein